MRNLKLKSKKNLFAILLLLIFFPVLTATILYLVFNKSSPSSQSEYLSLFETSFLESSGFLNQNQLAAKNNISRTAVKSSSLIEQNINSKEESFEILATKLELNQNSYRMAFKLENKTDKEREFYLIPASKENQMDFQEIIGSDGRIGEIINRPLAEVYNVDSHKRELKPELAQVYKDIAENYYSAKPVRIVLSPKSTFLGQSKWKINSDSAVPWSSTDLNPVYLLVYGSAGGVKDDLVILNVHSHPQQGENWEVEFTTQGQADLKIIPNDQATIEDDEFISLFCDLEERIPQILQEDVIYFPDWECQGVGRVIHYTKKAGNHTLRFEFGGEVAFAYNAVALTIGAGGSAPSGWLTGWARRKKITIDNTNVDADLTNFPLYVKITNDANIGASARTDGYDLRFTSSNGTTLLSYERESFAIANGRANANIWVKVPAIDDAVDTDIYVYYNKSDASDGQDTVNVWDANYKGVYHFNNDSFSDSSAAGYTAVNSGTDNNSSSIIAGGRTWVSTNSDYATVADNADHDPGGSMTVSLWFRTTTSHTWDVALVDHDGNSYKWGIFLVGGASDTLYYSLITASGTSTATNTTTYRDGNWHYAVGVYDKTLSSQRAKLYVDGTNIYTANGYNEDITAGVSGLHMGYWSQWGNYFNGSMDEIRYSSAVARSAEWIKFEYNNMYQSDQELTWGAETSIGAALKINGVMRIK